MKFAMIELPAGVYFYSERYPDLEGLRTVTLAWNDTMDVSHLPVVVQAKEAGAKKIYDQFYDMLQKHPQTRGDEKPKDKKLPPPKVQVPLLTPAFVKGKARAAEGRRN